MALQSTTALATITLQSAATEVSFTEIPSNYRDLVVVTSIKVTSGAEPRMRINGDTGSNYSFIQIAGDGSSTLSNTGTTTGGWLTPNVFPSTTDFDLCTVAIIDANATDKNKLYLSRWAGANSNALAVRWGSTAAVSSLTFYMTSQSFAIGSTFSLYGRIA